MNTETSSHPHAVTFEILHWGFGKPQEHRKDEKQKEKNREDE